MDITQFLTIMAVVQSLCTQTSAQLGPFQFIDLLNKAIKETPLSALRPLLDASLPPKSNETSANSTDPIQNLVTSLLGGVPLGALGANSTTDPSSILGLVGGLGAPLLSPSDNPIAVLVRTINSIVDALTAILKNVISKVLNESGLLFGALNHFKPPSSP